jgi:hypothetical protein
VVVKVIEFEQKSDVKDALELTLKEAPDLDCVLILGICKDGSQLLRSSTMSAMEKSFLCAFLNAWMTKWFRLSSDEPSA